MLLLLLSALAAAEPLVVGLPSELDAELVEAPGELQVWVSGEHPGLLSFTRSDDRAPDVVPTCSGGGVDLFAPDHADMTWIPEVCAALGSSPPALLPGPRRPAGEGERPPSLAWTASGVWVDPAILDSAGRLRPALWPWRPLHAVLLPWLLLVLLVIPRRREPWAIAAAALVVRLALTPDRALMGADAPFERYVTATGLAADPSAYGGTWAAMLGPAWLLVGRPQQLAHLAGLFASVMAIVLAWELARRWFDEHAARATAVFLATMPLVVALARTEDSLPLAALLQVTAMLGLARQDQAGGALTAMSCVLLASLHPLQIPFALLVLVPLAAPSGDARFVSPHRVAAVFAGALVLGEAMVTAWRAVHGEGVVDGLQVETLSLLAERGYIAGPGGRLAPSDPAVTPIGVTALAITSLLWTPAPHRRAMALAWSALVITTLPWLHLPDVEAAVRMQMPAQTWVAVLGGLAWACIDMRARRLWVIALVVSWYLARTPLHGGQFPWTAEHEALRRALPLLPEDAIVRFRAVQPGSPWQGRFYQLLMQGVWIDLDQRPLRAGEYRWVGLADVEHEPDACHLGAVWETMAPVPDGSRQVAIGLYEVEHCRIAEAPLLPPTDDGKQTLLPTPP